MEYTNPEPSESQNNNLNQPGQTSQPNMGQLTPASNSSNLNKSPKRSILIRLVMLIGLVLFATGIIILLQNHSKKSISQASNPNACINKVFVLGDSDNCVSDAQTMVNFLETDNLNECSFKGAETLDVSGNFDSATKAQIITVQNWLNCYNKQEGAPASITANGNINPDTWSAICTYAYIYPKQAGQSSSPYYKAAQIAGKDAGC